MNLKVLAYNNRANGCNSATALRKLFIYTGWLKKSKLLYCVNSLLFLSHPVESDVVSCELVTCRSHRVWRCIYSFDM